MHNCLCDFRMQQNGQLHVAVGANRMVEFKFLPPRNQLSNLSVQTGFPKTNGSHGERGAWKKYTNGYLSVTCATAISHY